MILIPFAVILVYVIYVLAKEKKQNREIAQVKFKNYTGRVEGRILESHWNKINSGKYIRDPETGRVESQEEFIVTYEFVVDGQTYMGTGVGSTSLSRRQFQTICYDPSDPNQNCTLYYLNGEIG